MKKLIIFDLDGTLLDTSSGIMHCYSETGIALNLKPRSVADKTCVIGGPLSNGFNTLYYIDDDELVSRASEHYRTLYKSDGIKMFEPYEGIRELLISLRKNNIKTAVATLKYEPFAIQMLNDAGLGELFDIIKGYDKTEKCTKAYILNQVIDTMKADRADCALVGDSEYDAGGAKEAGIDFIGVSYGFGIKKDRDFEHIFVADSPSEIADFIIGYE